MHLAEKDLNACQLLFVPRRYGYFDVDLGVKDEFAGPLESARKSLTDLFRGEVLKGERDSVPSPYQLSFSSCTISSNAPMSVPLLGTVFEDL